MEKVLLIRYGEIGLKGQNRKYFEDTLRRNILLAVRNQVSDNQDIQVLRSYGRFYLTGFDAEHQEECMDVISKIPGVVGVCPAIVVDNVVDAVEEGAVAIMKEAVAQVSLGRSTVTFKVSTKRPNKSFPFTSPEMNQRIGAVILKNVPGLSVDLHNPDIILNLEIREKGTYLYVYDRPGPGGLPVGVSGRGTVLISGGIDSPVSAYMAMKRGVDVNALHFWSYPITGQRAKDKVVDICKVLRQFHPQFRLFIAPFTDIQTQIIEKCPENYRVITMRRMMMRVATEFCKNEGGQVIFTGENLGQVASQTLESLTVIEDAAGLPILRPLICFDKTEIIDKAKEIGTYDISCLPYEDCCSVFVPKHPVTKPTLERAIAAEKNIDIDLLVKECVEGIREAQLEDDI